MIIFNIHRQRSFYSPDSIPDFDFSSGLVGYYALDGNLLDSSGNGFHITKANANSPSYTSGNVGQAVVIKPFAGFIGFHDFSMSSNQQDIPFAITLQSKISTMSVNQFFFGLMATKSAYHLWLDSAGEMRVRVYSSSSEYIGLHIPNPNILINENFNLLFQYDGSGTSSGLKIYINGIEQYSLPYNAGTYTFMQTGSSGFSFGSYHTSSQYPVNGYIDEFYVYKNRIFNTEEIAEIENRRVLGKTLIE